MELIVPPHPLGAHLGAYRPVDPPSKGKQKRKDVLGNYFRGETIDLSLKYSDSDKYVWEIIETYHPSEFGIQPVQFMF